MNNGKIRVGFVTSSLLLKTGFSSNARALIPYLYKTEKYEIHHLNQGVGDDPQLQKFPWHNEGTYRKGTFDETRFNNPQDEGYRRHVAYGNCAVEDFILRNKLEVLILEEDGWAYDINTYLKSKWYSFLKENVVLHTTSDSLPILPLYKEYAENCSNVWFWSSFAEKALKQENFEKYKHVKTVHGCTNTKDYYSINLEEKLRLRKEFNIDPNTILFIQLGRNQLRKLYPQTIESFAIFKKQNPIINAKLFFHLSFSEGWPLERLMKENGLNKEDVLVTYFCRDCGRWEIKPFEGEDKDCRYCGIKGLPGIPQDPRGHGQITPGVTSTISNKEMSKIYGIADAAVSVFTSGGLELFSVESLLCELPLLCSDYSCGEDFTCNDFVFSLDGNYTYEIGTGFKKHVPNINTMVNFYKTICNLSYEQRKEIGNIGRQWALKTFDVSTIGPIFEEWLDSRKRINWDYKYPPEKLKNPNAIIPNIQDNIEWLKIMYKDILNMDVTDEDEGLKGWLFRLKQNQPREEIDKFFRQVAQQKNQEITQQQNNEKQAKFEDLLDNNGKKRFLIVCKESIGDCVYCLGLLKSFRKSYDEKEWDLYLACDPIYNDIFIGNEYLHKVLPYQNFMDSEPFCIGQGNNLGLFNGFCHVTAMSQKFLNYLTNDNIDLQLTE